MKTRQHSAEDYTGWSLESSPTMVSFSAVMKILIGPAFDVIEWYERSQKKPDSNTAVEE